MAFLFFKVKAEYDDIVKCKKRIEELNDEFQHFDSNTPVEKLQSWKAEMKRANEEYQRLLDTAAKHGEEYKKKLGEAVDAAEKKVTKANDKLKEQNDILDDLTKKLTDSTNKYNQAKANNDEAGMKRWKAEMERNQNAVNIQRVNVDDASGGLDKAQTFLDKARDKAEDFSKQLVDAKNNLVVIGSKLDVSQTDELYIDVLINEGKLDDCKQRLDDLITKAQDFDSSTPLATIKNWKDEVRQVEMEYKTLSISASNASKAYGNAIGKAVKEAKDKVDVATAKLRESKEELDDIDEEIKRLSAEVDAAKKKGNVQGEAYWGAKLSAAQKIRTDKEDEVSQNDSAQTQAIAALDALEQKEAEVKGQTQELRDKIDEVKDKVKEAGATGTAATIEASNGAQKYSKAMSMMPEPIQKAAGAVKNFGNMMKTAFSSGPMIVIAAIAAGLASLYRWFNKTAEGEETLARITGYLSGVWEGFLDLVDRGFKKIYEAAKDALGYVWDKMINFKQTIDEIKNTNWTEIFSGFGKAFIGELEKASMVLQKLVDLISVAFGSGFDVEQMKKAMQELEDAFEDTIGGKAAKAVAKAVVKEGEELHRRGAQGSRESVETLNLYKQITKYQSAIVSIDKQIAAARDRMSRATATTADKIKEQEKILDLIRKKENLRVAVASAEKARTKIEVNGATNSEALRKLSDAQNKVMQADQERNSAVVQAEEELARLKQQAIAEMHQQDEQNMRLSEEYARKQADLIFQQEQMQIDALAEGAEKRRRQRDLDYNKEAEQIRRQYEDSKKDLYKKAEEVWRQHNDNKSLEWFNGIIDEPLQNMDDAAQAAREFFYEQLGQIEAENVQAMDALKMKNGDVSDIVNQYKSMYQKRRELDENYAYDRTRLESQIIATRSELEHDADNEDAKIRLKTLEESLKEMDAQHIKAVLDLDLEGVKKQLERISKNPAYFAAMQNAAILSTQTINDLTKALEFNREALTDLPPDQLKVITDMMERLMEVKVNRDPYKAMKESAKQLSEAQLGLQQNQTRLKNAVLEHKKASDELAAAQAEYNALEKDSNATEEQRLAAYQRILELQKNLTESNILTTNAQNAVNNSITEVYSKTNMLDKANAAVLSKVKEMSSGFRQIGQQLAGMDLGFGAEMFGKVTDVVTTILDGIVQAKEMARQMQEQNAVTIDLEAANIQMSAAASSNTAADKNVSAASEEQRAADVSLNAANTNVEAALSMADAANKNLEAAGIMTGQTTKIPVTENKPEVKIKAEDIKTNIQPPKKTDTKNEEKLLDDEQQGNMEFADALSSVATVQETAAASQEAAGATMGTAADQMLAAASTMQANSAASGAAGAVDGATGGTTIVNTESGAGAMSKGAAAMSYASSIIQGIQMGMSVGSKLAEIFDSTGVTGEKKYEKYAKKLGEINEMRSSVDRYRLAILKAKNEELAWFAASGMSNLKNSWKEATVTKDAYFKKLTEQQAAYRNQSKHDGDWLGNVVVGSIAGAITGAIIGTGGTPGIGTLVGAAIGGVAGGIAGAQTSFAEQALGNGSYQKNAVSARNNLRIETRAKKKSFMWIGGHDQETADLSTWAKQKYGADLFDKDGWINKELAEEILDTYSDKLQGETEATIKELVKLKDQYDDYQKQLKDYVSSLYSPLVDNFVDAMWQWFDTGRDALYAFRDAASDTFRDIMSDMMKTIILEKVVDGYQDSIKGLYEQYLGGAVDESTLIKGVTNLTNDLMGRYEEQMPVLQSMMTSMADTFETLGINLGQNQGTGSGSSKVTANVTQDSIDEANGRMTAIHLALLSIEATIIKYGEMMALQETYAAEQEDARRGGERQIDYSYDISDYGESVIALTQANMEQQLNLHAVKMNALAGISDQIAESYLELQGIHDDTTSMNKIMAKVDTRLEDWEKYIQRL